MGEDRESGATQYTFLGVLFDHTHRAVSLSEKFVRSVRAMSALNSLTIAEMEVIASRFLNAAAILGTRLCDHDFLSRQCDDDYPHLTGDCAGDIPGEPSAGSGWFGREITTHHREQSQAKHQAHGKGIGRHHQGCVAPWMESRFYSRLRRR
ncbi:putative target of rapamycin (TOR) kinase 1 [Trypanosoma cruzi]|uniref:Putative target of rapamycin (TOR) kinase 1 n=1 Tax=Trypanosoma cruzi TaxID=5693 RepID=A0A2V2X741_TRYCR|nr:putative target of rapamycin (TOR) kinase 1 [Trypanosoma cruzi]